MPITALKAGWNQIANRFSMEFGMPIRRNAAQSRGAENTKPLTTMQTIAKAKVARRAKYSGSAGH